MYAITIPKWGLSMEEGTVVQWLKAEGDPVAEGEEVVEIETDKINNGMESPASGTLRRIVAPVGQKLKVGALIAVLADAATPDAEVDAFVQRYGSGPELADGGAEAAGGFVHAHVDTHLGPIHLARGGAREGVPVVLLHGFASDLNSWLFTMEVLAARHPVVALDLPGHGESTKLVGDGASATIAQAVAEALQALGLERVHLVAHSWGAAVAARLAAAQPARVDRVVAIAPALYAGTRLSADFLEGLATGRRARDLQPWLQQLVADPALVTSEMVENVVRFKRLDGVEEALEAIRLQLTDDGEAAAVRGDAARLAGLAVVQGEQDQVVGQVDPAGLPAAARVVTVAGAGHLPHLERVAEVNAALLSALAQEPA